MWKCGFPENVCCIIQAYRVAREEPLEAFCHVCDGLGVRSFFDPSRVVAHPELSLPAGAVRGWDRRNAYYFQMIQALASTYYTYDYRVLALVLPPVAQHWVVIIKVRGSTFL